MQTPEQRAQRQAQFKHFQKLPKGSLNRARYVAYLNRRKIYDLGFKSLARKLGGVILWNIPITRT